MRIFISILVLSFGLVFWVPPAQADVIEHNMSEDYTYVQVINDSWQPNDFDDGIYVPTPHMILPKITLDGIDDELEWRRTTEVTVPLSFGRVEEVFVKALYSDTEVFISVRWADETENRDHHPWVWSPRLGSYIAGSQVEDSLMLSFEAGCEWMPSLLAGIIYDFDAWHWLAARSDPVGQAWDLLGTIQDQSFNGKFTPYQTRHMETEWSVKYIRDNPANMNLDSGELDRIYHYLKPNPESFYRAIPDDATLEEITVRLPPPQSPPADEKQTFPQFMPVKLEGDTGDVNAKGHWEDGYWTVEFNRKLKTKAGMATDSVFDRLYQFSVMVFDQEERIDQSSESGRLVLHFLPQEKILVGD